MFLLSMSFMGDPFIFWVSLLGFLGLGFGGIGDAISSVGSSIGDTASSVADGVSDAASSVGDTVSDVGSTVWGTAEDAAEDVSDTVEDVSDDVSDTVTDTVDESTDFVETALEDTGDQISDTFEPVGDFAENAFNETREAVTDVGEDFIEGSGQGPLGGVGNVLREQGASGLDQLGAGGASDALDNIDNTIDKAWKQGNRAAASAVIPGGGRIMEFKQTLQEGGSIEDAAGAALEGLVQAPHSGVNRNLKQRVEYLIRKHGSLKAAKRNAKNPKVKKVLSKLIERKQKVRRKKKAQRKSKRPSKRAKTLIKRHGSIRKAYANAERERVKTILGKLYKRKQKAKGNNTSGDVKARVQGSSALSTKTAGRNTLTAGSNTTIVMGAIAAILLTAFN